jgi:GNAT superfamily N-acetyltransferase
MNQKISINIDLNNETIKIYSEIKRIGKMLFLVEDTHIHVGDITIDKKYRLQGYGRMLINTIKGIAQYFNKPIHLISYLNKIPFYEKMGFNSLTEIYNRNWIINGTKINVKNFNPDKPIINQISNCDMLWVPDNIIECDIFL